MTKQAETDDPEHAQLFAIGTFVKEFSRLEFAIKLRIEKIFGPDQGYAQAASVLIENVETVKLVDVLPRLARLRGIEGPALEEIEDARNEFLDINRERVLVVSWALGDDHRDRCVGGHAPIIAEEGREGNEARHAIGAQQALGPVPGAPRPFSLLTDRSSPLAKGSTQGQPQIAGRQPA
jgi:hypothetical protein